MTSNTDGILILAPAWSTAIHHDGRCFATQSDRFNLKNLQGAGVFEAWRAALT
jgi:hypothetical protein